MQSYDTLSQAMQRLQERGYTKDFNLKENCIHCEEHEITLHPEDFKIDEFYRFEGMSSTDDNSILYAISSNDSTIKGVLVDAYGVYASSLSKAMIEKLKFRP